MNAAERIAENLAEIQQRIAAAATRSGRQAADVRLVAVTKYVDASVAELVLKAGCGELGESRPQQLWEKAEALESLKPRWHFVGHLQRNKIRRTLPHTTLIHSVDNESTLMAIDRIAGELAITSDILLEVNTSGDEAKDGLRPDEVPAMLEAAGNLVHTRVCGLMTMAALVGGVDVARKNFSDLRKLRDSMSANCPDNVSLGELSMGMSNDFEVAIEEGATIVRIGSILFQGLT